MKTFRRLGIRSSSWTACKPFPLLLMFKVLVLQGLNNHSNDQTEYMIKDRLSYMRFLGLSMEDPVPDAKTIWHYREMFVRTGALEKLFKKFDRMLSGKGYSARKGTIIDATIVNAPVQRNTREENRQVKRGEVPEEWKENPSKLAQKDTDARWGNKYGTYTFGYKAHVATDVKNKFIRNVVTTSAEVHDSRVFGSLLAGTENSSRDVHAARVLLGAMCYNFSRLMTLEKLKQGGHCVQSA